MNGELFMAAQEGMLDLYKLALKNGADINEKNSLGQNTLMIACEYNHLHLAQFIVGEGVNVDLEDYLGKTAYDYAKDTQNDDLIALFDRNTRDIVSYGFKSVYPLLIDNLCAISKNIMPLLEKLEFNKRPYVLEDFTKALLLAVRGSDFIEMYQFSFGLMSHLIMADSDSQIKQIKALPERDIVNMFLEQYKNQSNFFEKLDGYNYEFSFNSFVLFSDSELDILKKALYEFCEVIVKADGTVTVRESYNLKEVSAKYFSDLSTVPEIETQPAAQNEKPKGTLDDALKELNDLIGLDNIKQDIKSLINIINSNRLREKEGLPQHKFSLHSVFMGPPGTGKTTIARILADIYNFLGVFPESNFVETDRAGLVAGYVGQTAIKTASLIDKAMNGILFIDEAYTLKRSDEESDFGQEAIDILLKRMEDSRDNLVIIVAGYEQEMNYFIDSNPGLKSRFNRYFYFKVFRKKPYRLNTKLL